MARLIGIMLLFCSCVAIGIYISNKTRSELKLQSKGFEMLTEIKSLLRFNQPSKPALFEKLCKMGYGELLDGDAANGVLREYLERLGTRDLHSELEAANLCIERYSAILADKKAKADGKCKLSVGLGVLFGTFLVVILI